MQMLNGIDGGWLGFVWRCPAKTGSIGRCGWLLLILGLVVGLPKNATAQTPVVIGPSSTVQWEMPVSALAFTYTLSVDGVALPVLQNVTCANSTAGMQTCKVLAATIVPIGSHSLTLTATSGGQTSLPSAPYAYLTVVIPVPQGLRLVP